MSRRFLVLVSAVMLLGFVWWDQEKVVPSVTFESSCVEVGKPLRVSVSGYPPETEFSYEWYIDGEKIDCQQGMYIPTEKDLEKFIQVKVITSEEGTSLTSSVYCSRLPVCYLEVKEEIVKESYILASMKMQGNTQYVDSQYLYSGDIQIRGRGNSTWNGFSKKPYKIKLEAPCDLLGMGANKHWVLLANYPDETLMRNKVAYDLSGVFGMEYTQSQWVTLILNGEYMGNYLLCEQIRIDDTRVNITDWEKYAERMAKELISEEVVPVSQRESLELALEQDLSWLSTGVFSFDGKIYDLNLYMDSLRLTGGFLMEIDQGWDELSKFWGYVQPIMFKNPKYAYTNQEIMGYAEAYFTAAFEAMIESEDLHAQYNGRETSYTELFDVHSLAAYVLIQEIFYNYDARLKSTFLYKDVDSLAYMGPIWDLDWSSGWHGSNRDIDHWWTIYFRDHSDEVLWYAGVIRDPYFLSEMKKIWDTHRDEIMSLTTEDGVLETHYKYLCEAGRVNSEKWFHRVGFENGYIQFKDWLTQRIHWLDAQFKDMDTLIASIGAYKPDPKVQMKITSDKLVIEAPYGSVVGIYYNGVRQDELIMREGKAECSNTFAARKTDSDVLVVRIYDEHGVMLGSNYTDFRD